MDNVVLPNSVEAFINAFRAIGKGQLSLDAAEKLQMAVKATLIEGKKSTVTIKLNIKPNIDDQILIEGEVSARIPQPKVQAAFFVDTQTYLPTRNRPEQQILPNIK